MGRMLVACMLLAACDQSSAEPIASLGTAPIPCNAPMNELRRNQAAAFVKAGNLDAANELISRQTCGAWEGMPAALIDQLAWASAEHAAILYQVGDFDTCHRYTKPNEQSGLGARHPALESIARTHASCASALAKESALFSRATRCKQIEDDHGVTQKAFGFPDGTACFLVEKCGDSYLVRDGAKTKLTVPKGNLVDPVCGKWSSRLQVRFGRDDTLLVDAGGREYDGATWHPYSRHLYRLDGTTLTFVREVRSPADLEAR
jgi:hypothetical protein